MGWTVSSTARALKQLQQLDKPVSGRIREFVDQRLVGIDKPQFLGHARTGDLRGRRTYCVGSHRLICELQEKELVIVVVKIGHRRDVYA